MEYYFDHTGLKMVILDSGETIRDPDKLKQYEKKIKGKKDFVIKEVLTGEQDEKTDS